MEFKEQGNAALKAKDYVEAVKCYTKAIDSGEAVESLHVFYGNRSAAHLHGGDKDNALKDAKKCVSVKCDWAKGHSRLGAAYFAKNQMSLAKDAYQKAMELDPGTSSYKESFENANKRDRINRGVDPAPSYNNGAYQQQFYVPPAAKWTAPTPTSVNQLLFGGTANIMNTSRTVVHVLMVVLVVLYLTPTSLGGEVAFRRFFMGAILSYVLLLAAHGVPKFNMDYGQKLVTDPSMHYLFYCIIFLSGRPKLLALAPPLLYCLFSLCEWFSKFFALTSPGTNATMQGLVDRIAPGILGIPASEWEGLSGGSKWSRAQRQLPQRVATFEIAIGFLLIFELIQGMQGLLTMFMYWSGFLRMRYMISQDCKTAFTQVDTAISGYTSRVSMVHRLYGMVKSFMASQVAIPKPGEQAASSGFPKMPKCTIM
jgi:hypothetical protein